VVTRLSPDPFRYFLVVALQPGYALAILAAILAIGAGTIAMAPGELDAGLGMVLFAQMFLASTGFAPRARQGHFDPLLTRQTGRPRVIAVHWLISIAPGVLAWAILAGIAAFSGTPDAISAIGGARTAALLIVSATAWTAGFWLPRGAAGMLWMALLMGLVLQRADLLAAPAGSGVPRTLVLHTATLLVCPFLLLGKHPPLADGALASSIVLPLILLCAVWRRARRLDVYLLDRS
jgi:hypothetical protein